MLHIAVLDLCIWPRCHFYVTGRKESMGKPTIRNTPATISQSRTTRLDVAAYLLVRGFEISDVKLNGPTATFAFQDPALSGDAAIKDFYNGAQAPANEYADAQKRVRDLMWEAKRQR
jgi:Domain of unknown function (DUF5659)